MRAFAVLFLVVALLAPSSLGAFASEDEVRLRQEITGGWDTGDRIAFWAVQFIGVPYDPDPLGEYVTRKKIVSDERVDCLYLVFRSVELALGKTPEDSVRVALERRFAGVGRMEGEEVINYDERFRYGEDMLASGKWGDEVTAETGELTHMAGSRGRQHVAYLRPADVILGLQSLRSGDIIYFVKSPDKRIEGEIIGHMGILKREKEGLFLIHANGRKNHSGRVERILLAEYVSLMPFVGARISRFR